MHIHHSIDHLPAPRVTWPVRSAPALWSLPWSFWIVVSVQKPEPEPALELCSLRFAPLSYRPKSTEPHRPLETLWSFPRTTGRGQGPIAGGGIGHTISHGLWRGQRTDGETFASPFGRRICPHTYKNVHMVNACPVAPFSIDEAYPTFLSCTVSTSPQFVSCSWTLAWWKKPALLVSLGLIHRT